jgi:hypothetical protein
MHSVLSYRCARRFKARRVPASEWFRGAADQRGDAEKVYPMSEQDKVHRTVRPIPHQRHVGLRG